MIGHGAAGTRDLVLCECQAHVESLFRYGLSFMRKSDRVRIASPRQRLRIVSEIQAAQDRKLEEARRQRQLRRQ
jgi:hypothetical protein